MARTTDGWWLSATTVRSAPRALSACIVDALVCEPSGNSTHGPHVSGEPISVPEGAITTIRSDITRVTVTPGGCSPGSTHTIRSRAPRRRSAINPAEGATEMLSATSGRSIRNELITESKCSTAATSMRPRRIDPREEPRIRSAHAARSPVRATTWRACSRTGVADARSGRRRPSRSKSGTPTRRSSSARPCDSADGVTPSEAAASAQVGATDTATRYSSCRRLRSGSAEGTQEE